MRTSKIVAPFIALATAALLAGGCENGTEQTANATPGSVSMALTNPAGDCVSGTVLIYADADGDNILDDAEDDTPVSNFLVACADNPEVPLMPGDYLVTMSGITCSRNNAGTMQTAISCTLNPDPTDLTIRAGDDTPLNLNFTAVFDDDTTDDFMVGPVGAVSLALGTATVVESCGGTSLVCGTDQTCYVMNSTAAACYTRCTEATVCTGATPSCLPIVLDTSLGHPGDFAALPRVCMPTPTNP